MIRRGLIFLGTSLALGAASSDIVLEYRGDRFADTTNTFVMPSYVVCNVTASYRWNQWDLSLGVRNLADEFYFAGTTGDRAERIELGTEREYRLGARWSF